MSERFAACFDQDDRYYVMDWADQPSTWTRTRETFDHATALLLAWSLNDKPERESDLEWQAP